MLLAFALAMNLLICASGRTTAKLRRISFRTRAVNLLTRQSAAAAPNTALQVSTR